MNLVIVESPAKAKTINKYLGKDYYVIASFGHIRDLPSKNDSVRPEEDFAMDYQISAQSHKHVREIVENAKKAEAIILATDPDREGEAISWHIIETLKLKRALKKNVSVQRVVFHEITKKAVLSAINAPRDIDMNLVNAQQARRALDYLVGFTLSPILWKKLPGSKSAGRVQSVALKLICEREYERDKFIVEEYWSILGKFKDIANKEQNIEFQARLTHFNGDKLDKLHIKNEIEANKIKDILLTNNYKINNIEKKQSKRNPAPPFTTSSLQQEASRKLGFGAKNTMMVAQKLYEGSISVNGDSSGLITYMRTDAVSISKDAIKDVRKYIKSEYGYNYVPEKERFYANKAKNSQEAHEAIRPTDLSKKPSEIRKYLSEEQYKLYNLIWKRTIASQMQSAIFDQVVVDIISNDQKHILRANGSSIAFDGFIKVYKEGLDDKVDDDEKMLPPLSEKSVLDLKDIEPNQHFTQPPPRYTEASLVKKLEELGIGRPSTYATIISVLQARDYVTLEQKRFMPADRGKIVTAFLEIFFQKYVEYDFTATLEDELDHISAGDIDWKKVLHNFWHDFYANVGVVNEKTISDVISSLNQTLGDYLFPHDDAGNVDRNCPMCEDGRLSLKLGKFGAFIGCSNYPECKNTKQLGQENDDSEESGGFEDKILGLDENTNLEIIFKKGPYGYYIQLGDKDVEKPKRVGIPKNKNIEEVDLEYAKGLISLPRNIGKHPETNKVITASIGRFGPYLRHDNKYTSLKEDDVLTIGMNRAVALIAESKKNTPTALRVIGKYPKTENDISVFDGKFGPYIKYQKTNVSLPKDVVVDDITLEEAVSLIDKKKETKKKKK